MIKRLAGREREWHVPLSLRRPRWWMRGFLSRSAVLYDLEHNEWTNYVSDVQRYFSTRKMVYPRLRDVVNNKLTTHLLLQAIGELRTPTLLGIYWRGGVHRFPLEERIPVDAFLEGLGDGETVFVKPLTGAEGNRIIVVTRQGGDFLLDEQSASLRGVQSAIHGLRRPMIIEEGLQQHPASAALNPRTTNTVRLLTILDTATREPFIAVAVQRIGTDQSAPLDSWNGGGLSAGIDLVTGELGFATRLPHSHQLEWFGEHPETGAAIRGVKVPLWDELTEVVLRAARTVAFLEYASWDVVATTDGPAVLEASIDSGMNMLQIHSPLLVDTRVRTYLEERGVV